jgi:hypothetical protein
MYNNTNISFIFMLGGVIPLDVEADILWGYPAKLNALPEDCYPEEDTLVDITSVEFNGQEFESEDISYGTGNKQQCLDDLIIKMAIEKASE